MRKLRRSTAHPRGLGRPGIQKALAVTLAAVFLAPSVLSAAGGKLGWQDSGDAKPASDKPTAQERVLKVPAGAIVVVSLRDKEKVKGRMGDVTGEAFTVQTAKGNAVQERTVSFADVKSIKTASTPGHKVCLGLAIAGVAVGAVVIGILVWASTVD